MNRAAKVKEFLLLFWELFRFTVNTDRLIERLEELGKNLREMENVTHQTRVSYVKDKLDEINQIKDTDAHFTGRDHFEEDQMWEMVLTWIALGDDDNAKLASLALESKKIEFERYYD